MQDEVDFCLQINTKVFYKMIVSLWVSVARQAQITKNNQFTLSLQYLKENKDEVDFLPAGKCWRFFQIDTIILGVWPGIHKWPKITSLPFLYNMLKSDSIIFWWVWSSFPKVPKVASCPYNISKDKLKMGFIMKFINSNQDQNFYKLDYQFLMKARHVQSTWKRKFY